MQRVRTDGLKKSLEFLDGKITHVQKGQLTKSAQDLVDTKEEEKTSKAMRKVEKKHLEIDTEAEGRYKLFIHTPFRDQMGKSDFEEEYIISLTWLGKKQDTENRSMLVKLDTKATNNSILRNRVKLKDADEKYQGLGLERDYTPNQQAKRSKPIEEAKKQRETDRSGNHIYKRSPRPAED